MRYLALPALLLLFIQPLAAQHTSDQDLIARFDYLVDWMEGNTVRANDGWILQNDAGFYRVELNLIPCCDPAFSNVPGNATFQADTTFRGRYVLMDSTKAGVYLSDSQDFEQASFTLLGDEMPETEKWHAVRADSTVEFNYGWLYANAWYADALTNMYRATGRQDYIERAREILLLGRQFIRGDTWLRYTLHDAQPLYLGMSQGIYMQSLDHFLASEPDAELEATLRTLAEGYYHTDEGTYNHWTNSILGSYIRDRVLGVSETDSAFVHSRIETLYDKIVQYRGRIPKAWGPHPGYPVFSSTYQTWDTKLVAHLSYIVPFDLGYTEYFPHAFREALPVNYGIYFAYNTFSALYMLKAYGMRSDSFIAMQRTSHQLWIEPTNPNRATGLMLGIGGIMLYDQAVRRAMSTEQAGASSTIALNVYPNPASAVINVILEHLPAQKSQIEVFDVLGRVVYVAEVPPGVNTISIPTGRFADGVYLVRMGGITESVVVLKSG